MLMVPTFLVISMDQDLKDAAATAEKESLQGFPWKKKKKGPVMGFPWTKNYMENMENMRFEV